MEERTGVLLGYLSIDCSFLNVSIQPPSDYKDRNAEKALFLLNDHLQQLISDSCQPIRPKLR